jgi:hypothetical protein
MTQVTYPTCQPVPTGANEGGKRTPSGRTELPRRFALHRSHDISGISGTGIVAFGTAYPGGTTTLAWCAGDITSVTVYDSPENVLQIHGHQGATHLVWIDTPGKHQAVPSPSAPGTGHHEGGEAG